MFLEDLGEVGPIARMKRLDQPVDPRGHHEQIAGGFTRRSWRFISRDCDGSETAFRGTYREVTPPERLVRTFEWEGMPGHVMVETVTFEDLGDRTKVTTTSLFHTNQERDGMLASGMERGVNESFGRLDELPTSLTAR